MPPADKTSEPPSDLKESRTFENLKAAFTSTAQSAMRYEYFALRADISGHLSAARLFRSAAEAERGQAQIYLDLLREVADPQTSLPIGSSEQNLESAIARSSYEQGVMYPGFSKTAREEGFDTVAAWFERMGRSELMLAMHFKRALKDLERDLAAVGDDTSSWSQE
jgi:rubrerythrin